MKKILIMAALAAMFAGCTATKIEFEQNKEGVTKYSIWHNDHWMKTSTERMAGGMSKDGQFSVELAGRDSSPSEEFNKTMKTYTAAIVSMMQIAAAAYNPSASSATQSVNAGKGASTAITVNAAQTEAKKEDPTTESAKPTDAQTTTAANAAACEGGDCTDKACTDGSCEVKPTENGQSLQGI